MDANTTLGNKVTHVRTERAKPIKQNHHCHWPGCTVLVAPALWGCREHWYKLPAKLRNRVWQTYAIGQEKSKTPSRAYVEVAHEVQTWIKRNYPNA